RQRTQQEHREVGLATAPRAHGELRRGAHDEAAAATCPGAKGGDHPGHDELVQEGGHLLLLEHPVDQFALDVLVEGGPLLERHRLRLRPLGCRGTAAHSLRSVARPGLGSFMPVSCRPLPAVTQVCGPCWCAPSSTGGTSIWSAAC